MANKKYDLIFTEEEKQNLRKEYLEGSSIREIGKKYNINCRQWINKKLLSGITRSFSEANINAHKKYPNNFRHTEETKQRIREIRLAYMKEHPENTAWRKRNKPSYPEKCFIKFLEENGYSKKHLIEREKSVFPYYIDFAFINEKIAIEIDGSQHINDQNRIERDEDKNNILINNGWTVLRFTENLVKTDWKTIKTELDNALKNHSTTVTKVGIFKEKKAYGEKVKRGVDGLSDKMRTANLNQRKVKERPSYEKLLELKQKYPMVKIGKMYGVTDNTIRKWIQYYEKLEKMI